MLDDVVFICVTADSPWAPYIDALRRPTSPVLWTREQLEQLQSPTIMAEVLDFQSEIQDTFQALIPYLCDRYPDIYNMETNTVESMTYVPSLPIVMSHSDES